MKKNSAIRSLEQKANKGSIKSAFQLYEYYSLGRFVEKDLDIAQKYFDIVSDSVKKSSLKINSLYLKGYRVFGDLEVDFSGGDGSSNVIVFCGPNGAGKTTVLSAISKILSWFSSRVSSPKSAGESLDVSDVNFGADYVLVNAEFILGAEIFNIELSKSLSESSSQKNNTLAEFTLLSEIYHNLNYLNKGLSLPLVAYFGVERALGFSRRDEKNEDFSGEWRQEKFDGYKKPYTGQADFNLFYKWFKYHHDVSNYNKSFFMERINDIGKEINSLIEAIEDAERNNSSILPALKEVLSSRRSELEILNKDVESVKYEASARLLKIVKSAFMRFLPEFTDFRIQYQPTLGMVVEKNGVTLSVHQLSHGEKSVLALIADISRRLILLNPLLDDPLSGNGIVMIDEIDLHLHPAWQQSVIQNLSHVFPNIQFLITTHSPQVLSTVSSDSIRVIAHQIMEDGKVRSSALPPKMQSKGTASADVMAEIQLVDPVPDVEEAHWLSRYKQLIMEQAQNGAEGDELREKILKHFGSAHHEWLECERLIRLQMMKDKLHKKES